jgi:site-specific DNA-methyltransferase (adenine-specific)
MSIEEVLEGKRKWDIVHGDCLKILPSFPDGFVDGIITDPPYAEKTHAGARGARPGVSLTTEKLIHFDSIDDEKFLEICADLVRVTRRWVLLFCDWRHSAAAFRSNLPVIRCGVWIKPDSAPQFTGDRPGTGWEAVLILHRKGKKKWNGGGRHAVWSYGIERNGLHPTGKPLPLIREWVKLFTERDELILDPFTGSGTTGVACLLAGRRFIGIEIDRNYCEISRRRLGDSRLLEDRGAKLRGLDWLLRLEKGKL